MRIQITMKVLIIYTLNHFDGLSSPDDVIWIHYILLFWPLDDKTAILDYNVDSSHENVHWVLSVIKVNTFEDCILRTTQSSTNAGDIVKEPLIVVMLNSQQSRLVILFGLHATGLPGQYSPRGPRRFGRPLWRTRRWCPPPRAAPWSASCGPRDEAASLAPATRPRRCPHPSPYSLAVLACAVPAPFACFFDCAASLRFPSFAHYSNHPTTVLHYTKVRTTPLSHMVNLRFYVVLFDNTNLTLRKRHRPFPMADRTPLPHCK